MTVDKHIPYNIPRVLKDRDRLVDALCGYVGVTMEGDVLRSFSSEISDVLRMPSYVVLSSIRSLAGTVMTAETLRDTSWRLAGNKSLLAADVSVPPWSVQIGEESAPVQVLSCRRHKSARRHDDWFTFRCRYLAGTPCPSVVAKNWSARQCHMVAAGAGFTRLHGSFPYTKPVELVGIRLLALLVPERCLDGRPNIHTVTCTSSMRAHNRGLMRLRARDGFTCPMNYTTPCHQCWRGYSRRADGTPGCPAACRPHDLILRPCRRCDKEAWFYPDDDEKAFCVDCS